MHFIRSGNNLAPKGSSISQAVKEADVRISILPLSRHRDSSCSFRIVFEECRFKTRNMEPKYHIKFDLLIQIYTKIISIISIFYRDVHAQSTSII